MSNPTGRVRWIINFLRFIAICQMLAFIAVFVPVEAWLAPWYAWLRLGPAPEVSAILRYVIGGAAFFQGAIGIWLWVILSDVPRYRALLIASAVIYLLAAPVLYVVESTAALPLWWRIYDFVWCFGVGSALVALCRRSSPDETRHNV
jgi:hypothetical protein